MKNPLFVTSLGLLCLALPVSHAGAQSSFGAGAAGTNPIGRMYNPPANPAPAATPTANYPGAAGAYNAGLGGGTAGPVQGYSSEPIEPNHKLNRGDRLNFQVLEERDPKWQTAQLVVTDSGDVNLPLGGPVSAAGKTVSQLTSDVKARLERDYYYHATVIVGLDALAPRGSRGRVYVTGAVRGEGAVDLPLDESLTVSQAIIKAGGFKDFGSMSVKVIRKNNPGKPIIVHVQDVRKGKTDKDLVLEPGDTIFVPEKFLNFN